MNASASDLPEDLTEVLRHVERTYPEEGCGVLLRSASGSWRTVPIDNVYDRYHQADPESFPRTARTAYHFDLRRYLEVCRAAEAQGERVACIFHSHVDIGAYFSAEDRAMAAPDGVPLHPGVTWLVVAVDGGRATAARLFTWDCGDFRELAVPLGERAPGATGDKIQQVSDVTE